MRRLRRRPVCSRGICRGRVVLGVNAGNSGCDKGSAEFGEHVLERGLPLGVPGLVGDPGGEVVAMVAVQRVRSPDVYLPPIPIPRGVLFLALLRDPIADAANASQVSEELIRGGVWGEAIVYGYDRFLSIVRTPETVQLRVEALKLVNLVAAPKLYLDIASELIEVHTNLSDWDAAATVFDGMLSALEQLHTVQLSVAGRNRALQRGQALARWAAYAFARVGRVADAVRTLERGRTREVGTSVNRDTADLSRLIDIDRSLADRCESDSGTAQECLGQRLT